VYQKPLIIYDISALYYIQPAYTSLHAGLHQQATRKVKTESRNGIVTHCNFSDLHSTFTTQLPVHI